MEFAAASGQNMLLVGPPGSGKTSMVNDFMDTQGRYRRRSLKVKGSGYSAQCLDKTVKVYSRNTEL